jgi:hypothetical protein
MASYKVCLLITLIACFTSIGCAFTSRPTNTLKTVSRMDIKMSAAEKDPLLLRAARGEVIFIYAYLQYMADFLIVWLFPTGSRACSSVDDETGRKAYAGRLSTDTSKHSYDERFIVLIGVSISHHRSTAIFARSTKLFVSEVRSQTWPLKSVCSHGKHMGQMAVSCFLIF